MSPSRRARRSAGRPVRIGITGPIGCGKSTVAAWLAELGARVIDADEVAHEVVEPGGPALAAVLGAFGPAVAGPDGTLDRAALGRIVFGDAAALARLESIVHPAVRPRILAAIAAADADGVSVVVEAIKLVEGGLASLCDEVWLVTCDPAVQRARLRGRGTSDGDAARRIAAQADVATRLAPRATRVLDASGSPEATRALVMAAYQAALAWPSRPSGWSGSRSPGDRTGRHRS